MVSPFMADAEKLAAVRASLPALASGIHLNTGSVGPLPAEVAAAMAEIEAYERDVGRASPDDALAFRDRMAEARAAVAAIVGGELDEVGLTHGVTGAMNAAILGLDWHAGDRVVTSTQEHGGGLGPLYSRRDRSGVEVDFVDVRPADDDDAVVAAFDRAITARTRVVAVSHVLWTTGAVMPVRAIADLAHARGALVVVDGAQAAGAVPVDVRALGADAYAVAGQRWLLGPEGTGAVWVAREHVDRIRPTTGGDLSFAHVDGQGTAEWFRDGRRFEGSAFHRPSITGMARAIGWLTMFVGLEYVHRRGTAAARRAAERLGSLADVEVLTPLDRMATLVTFRVRGWAAEAALTELGARIFLIARTVPSHDAIRISPAFFTTDGEVDQVATLVETMARLGPDAMPPRRTLPMFGEP